MNITDFNHLKAYLIPYPLESFSKPILIEPGNTYIGRAPNGSIQIANNTISRQHSRISCENGSFFIEDLGSQNGTFLNAKRIRKATLGSRDKITIGDRTFLFLRQTETIPELLLDPSLSATDTIAISCEKIDLSDLWAQDTQYAARKFIQQSSAESFPASMEDEKLAHVRLSLLYQLSENLRAVNDIDKVFDKGLQLIMQAIPAACCALIAVKSIPQGKFRVLAIKVRDPRQSTGDAIPMSETLFDWVLAERVTLVSENASTDSRFQDSDSIRIHGLRSIVCVPIAGKDKVIGLLYVQSNDPLDPISKEDAAFASAVANELALNIDNIRLRTTALRNECMAAIGLTVGNLAHNLKNLVALSQGAADLMSRKIEELGNAQIEKYWQWIQQSLSSTNKLSANILDYIKEDQLLLKPVDVNKLILNYRKAIEGYLSREGLKLEFNLFPKIPVWMMDEVQFHRALFNLIVNAADAVNKKKQARIRISTSLLADRYLVVSVADSGCGIPPQKIDKVLDLFFTTKGTKGTGLGLPMVQKFVEKAGGKLKFQSKEGVGSIFQMMFPKL